MQGWGAHMGDSQISGTWTHTDGKLHINCLELNAVIHALQHWAQVLQGHQVMIARDNSTVVFLYQQTRRDPFPHLVAVDSRASPLVRGSEHNFYGRLHAGVGCSHGGFPDFGYLDPCRPQAPHQLFGAQCGDSCPTALGSSAPGPPGHDRYGQFPDFGYLDPCRPQAPDQLFGAQCGDSCPTALGSSAPGPPGHGRYGQFDSSFRISTNKEGPIPPPCCG